jgi:peptidoglycan/LPS O-acetylase OafA/YrhL
MLTIRRAHLVVAWTFVAGVVIQVFLAGLGVFEGAARFSTHATWGFALEILPLVLLALAAAGRLGRRQVLYAAGLFGLFMLQSVFVAVRGDLPMVAALHPVNGFAILLAGIAMAREAWAARDMRAEASTAPQPAQGAAGR